MLDCISVENMRLSDALTIEKYVPSLELMHRAELGVPILPFAPGCLDGFDMVVDCLLGTGFQGGLRDNYRTAIEEINASNALVISVDINSGMNGDTGIRLAKEENKICTDAEHHPNAIPCPRWLDMSVVDVTSH